MTTDIIPHDPLDRPPRRKRPSAGWTVALWIIIALAIVGAGAVAVM